MVNREILSPPAQEDVNEMFNLYEVLGSMKAVSHEMGMPYHVVRGTMMKDPIRFHDTRAARGEDIAQRWETVEKKASEASLRMMHMYCEMLSHIESCLQTGAETDIPRMKGKGNMSGQEAMLYCIDRRVLEQIQKAGFNSAKISEGMRQIALMDSSPGVKDARRAQGMSDEELAQACSEFEAAGMPLPPGLAAWKAGRRE